MHLNVAMAGALCTPPRQAGLRFEYLLVTIVAVRGVHQFNASNVFEMCVYVGKRLNELQILNRVALSAHCILSSNNDDEIDINRV